MSPGALLKSWLLGDAGIATAVGGATGVLLQTASQNRPATYIRLTSAGAVPEQCHEGTLDEEEDDCRVQVDIFGPSLDVVDALFALVRPRCLEIGSIPIADYTEPHDTESGRWRRTLDVQFCPVDVPD